MSPQLESALSAALQEAASIHPDLAVRHRATFAVALRARVEQAPEPDALLGVLHVGDLLLGHACERADPDAAATFHEQVIVPLRALLVRTSGTSDEVQEILQRLSTRLLMGEDGASPKIATYEGRAPLLSWVRVAALRALSNLRRDEGGHTQKTTAGAPIPLPSIDPEIAALQRRFGASFQRAFHGAFAALAADERTLFRLHYLDGLPVGRAALVVGMSRATAFRRMQTARTTLVERTLAALGAELRLGQGELESLWRAVSSKLELSMGGLLRETGSVV